METNTPTRSNELIPQSGRPPAERPEAGAMEHVAQATNLMQALVHAAQDPQTDIAKVKELFGMHKEMAAIQAERAFLDALARTQARVEPVRKNLTNTHTNTKYASLAALLRAVTPHASAEGLSLTFNTDASPVPDCIRIIGTLSHRDGHRQAYTRDIPLDKAGSQGKANKTDVQAQQSSITYGMRGLAKMIYALSEEGDDKDGNPPPKQIVYMTADHQATVQAKAEEVSKTMLATVLKSYKVKSLAEIQDGEYARIIRMLENNQREKEAKAAAAGTQ